MKKQSKCRPLDQQEEPVAEDINKAAAGGVEDGSVDEVVCQGGLVVDPAELNDWADLFDNDDSGLGVVDHALNNDDDDSAAPAEEDDQNNAVELDDLNAAVSEQQVESDIRNDDDHSDDDGDDDNDGEHDNENDDKIDELMPLEVDGNASSELADADVAADDEQGCRDSEAPPIALAPEFDFVRLFFC